MKAEFGIWSFWNAIKENKWNNDSKLLKELLIYNIAKLMALSPELV